MMMVFKSLFLWRCEWCARGDWRGPAGGWHWRSALVFFDKLNFLWFQRRSLSILIVYPRRIREFSDAPSETGPVLARRVMLTCS